MPSRVRLAAEVRVTVRERLTFAAALAVGLATSSLGPVYDGLDWLLRVLGAVAVVGVVGLLARRIGLPSVFQPLVQLVYLGLYSCAVFARDTLVLGLVPAGATISRLQALVEQGLLDVETLAPPVPTTPGLVLLAVLGVGAVAVVVDLLAVVLGRAAVAGLPLLLLFAIPSAVLAYGLGWLPFTLTAAGWLGLLLVEGGDRVGRWGTPLRSGPVAGDDDTSLGRIGRRIGAAALGVAVVVPAILPGLDTRLLDGGAGDGLAGRGGGRNSTTYNPITRLSGYLTLPEPKVLFSYTTNDPEPDYLRLTTLDTYDDGQWSASQLRGDPDEDGAADGIPLPPGLTTAPRREIAMRLLITGLDAQWLPVPANPTDVDAPGRWVWDEQAETVFSAETSTGDLDEPFGLTAVRALPEGAALTDVGKLPNDIAPYAEPVPVTDTVRATLEAVLRDADNDFQRAVAIQDYLRDTKRFTYDVEAAEPPPGMDPLEFFLEQRRGFCEQYASSMAALLRSLALPARVAVGFTPGRRGDDGTWTVTTNEAHAWPEVWFDGAGWVRFEPTPRRGVTSLPDYAAPATGPSGVTPSDGPSASAAPQPTTSSSAGPQDPRLRDDPLAAPGALGDPRADDGLGLPSPLAILGLLALLLGCFPSVAAMLRRRHRRALPGPLPAWAQVHDDAADVGHLWRPADSPRTAARRLVADHSLMPPAADALERLAVACERVRFARDGAADGQAEHIAHLNDVATVRRALLSGAPARVRWRARLLPPSTVSWTAHLLGERIADLLDGADNAVTAVSRRLRLRSS